MQHEQPTSKHPCPPASRPVFFGFVAIAAVFLVAEHWMHVVPYLPLLLVALCPLLHFFHGRHGHGDDDSWKGSGGAHRR